MQPIYKNRLLKLAKLLRADAKKAKGVQFNLNTWSRPSDAARRTGNFSGRFKVKPKTVPVSCNTQACAVGLACISGAFKRQGLGYSFLNGDLGSGYALVPSFQQYKAWDAVTEFFDLSYNEANHLFDSASYSVKKGAAAEIAVAERIERFVTEH